MNVHSDGSDCHDPFCPKVHTTIAEARQLAANDQAQSSDSQPPGEHTVGRWAADQISLLAQYVAHHFPEVNTGNQTTTTIVVGLLDELRQHRAENSAVHQLRRAAAQLRDNPSAVGLLRAHEPVAEFLDAQAHDLDMAGTPSMTDSPGNLEHALKIARAILGTT